MLLKKDQVDKTFPQRLFKEFSRSQRSEYYAVMACIYFS